MEGGNQMGHDISGFNRSGEEIAYARFSMQNRNVSILYTLLDATQYDAGVSGSGNSMSYSTQQLEEALREFNRLFGKINLSSRNDFNIIDLKQIRDFIENCLATAQRDGNVRVAFA